MLRKFARLVITIIGAAFGFAISQLLGYVLELAGVDVTQMLGRTGQIVVEVIFAVIFAFIFFKLLPIFGRQSGKMATDIEHDLQGVSGSKIFAGAIGLVVGLLIALLITQIFSFINNRYLYAVIIIVLYAIFGYLGMVIATSKGSEIAASILEGRRQSQGQGQSNIWPIRSGRGKKTDAIPKIMDTSVIIDGRIEGILSTGFLEGPIVIPEFVLVELRHIADSADPLKRTRGRRGLDILKKIQNDYGVEIFNTDGEKALKEIPEVDVKLLKLAQIMNGKLVTNDYNLNKVAAINNVEVLNINKLANCLKPVVLPGEEMVVDLVKQGKDSSQAIGYLDDGTMIVAEDGRKMIGKTVTINVTSVLQTSAGRMIFGRLKNG